MSRRTRGGEMNSLILNGVVVGNPKASQTKEGATKCVFVVETDGRDLPLRFNVLAFGGPGETASKLLDGDEILLSGRMVASVPSKTMSIIANNIEVLAEENPTTEQN